MRKMVANPKKSFSHVEGIRLSYSKLGSNLATIHVIKDGKSSDIKAVVFDDRQILAIHKANSSSDDKS